MRHADYLLVSGALNRVRRDILVNDAQGPRRITLLGCHERICDEIAATLAGQSSSFDTKRFLRNCGIPDRSST